MSRSVGGGDGGSGGGMGTSIGASKPPKSHREFDPFADYDRNMDTRIRAAILRPHSSRDRSYCPPS
jgi:hypothetical protein